MMYLQCKTHMFLVAFLLVKPMECKKNDALYIEFVISHCPKI